MQTITETISAQELKKIVNLLPGYVCLKDLNGAIIYCNQSVADILNLPTPEDAIGIIDSETFGEQDGSVIKRNDRYVIENNVNKDFVERALDKHGNPTVYYSKKSPYHDDQGNVIGVMVVAIDIKELDIRINQLETEKEDKSDYINNMRYLEKLAPWFPGFLYWKGTDGVYLGCNENQRKIFEHIAPTIVGKTIFELLPHSVAEEINNVDNQIMQTGVGRVLQETMVDHSGEQYIVMSSKMPVINDSGEITGLLGVSIDITDRIRMERSLKRAKQAADAANNAKSDFIMNMSHDLRTPFVSIIGFSNALLQTEQTDANHEMLNHIFNASNQLLKIIDELIELASSEDGVVNANSRMNIRSMIDDVVKLTHPKVELKNLQLNVEIAQDVPRIVIGNKFALNRILLNLLGNSIKFTDQGSVTIKCEVLPSENNHVTTLRFIVEDTGIGIPQPQIKKIFDKFHRATSVKGRFEGTGLGLYFVKLLVEQMSGTITVDTDYQPGARFICDLPFHLRP